MVHIKPLYNIPDGNKTTIFCFLVKSHLSNSAKLEANRELWTVCVQSMDLLIIIIIISSSHSSSSRNEIPLLIWWSVQISIDAFSKNAVTCNLLKILCWKANLFSNHASRSRLPEMKRSDETDTCGIKVNISVCKCLRTRCKQCVNHIQQNRVEGIGILSLLGVCASNITHMINRNWWKVCRFQ